MTLGWSPDLDPTTAPYGVLMAVEPKKTGPWKDMTPEERSNEMKRRRALGKKNGKKRGKSRGKSGAGPRRNTRRPSDERSTKAGGLEEHAAYLFGKVETIIEYYSNSNGLPVKALTTRVASLLRD